jgi:hypothetical protein
MVKETARELALRPAAGLAGVSSGLGRNRATLLLPPQAVMVMNAQELHHRFSSAARVISTALQSREVYAGRKPALCYV